MHVKTIIIRYFWFIPVCRRGNYDFFNIYHRRLFEERIFEAGTAPDREYTLWKEVREYCFSLIKGKRTPLGFKFVLGLSASNIQKLIGQQGLDFELEDVRGLYINLKYDGKNLQCVTGTAMNLFTMDKSLEQAWDVMVQKFFTQKEISYEVM